MEKATASKQRPWYQQPWIYVVGVVALFAIISVAYFTPAAFEGRVLFQADGAAASGTGQDVVRHEAETGRRSLWTGSLFGGMPMYQISPSYPSAEGIKVAQNIYRLRGPIDFLPGDSYLVFMMLIGCYIFMRSWGTKRLLSIMGALLWAFSSYFLILIEAGHLWKLLALSYIPPTLAGLVYAFHRKKYWLGFLLTGFFSALQIYSNHIQMSYYFAFLMLAMVVAWGVEAAQKKEWKHFGKALLVVFAGGLMGIAINGTSLYHTYEYSQETMRGGREITVLDEPGKEGQNASGLDKEYITQWSYGISEMLTFLVPDAKGGASGMIGSSQEDLSNVPMESAQFVAQQNRYWGNQPFTAGPVYVGAFVLMLAIFGAIVAKGPMKWALLATTLLTIMLSWGHNFMWLTSLFIDYFPMYDKFRTPSSILVVAELTIPLFAVWALTLIIRDPSIIKREKIATTIAILLTAGVALLLWIFPTAGGPLQSNMEQAAFGQYLQQMPQLAPLLADLESVRASILQRDAVRSLIILAIGMLIIYLYIKQKMSTRWMLPMVLLLCFVDLWSVDKRYLNDEKYLPKSQVAARVQHQTPADKVILEDPSHYRVLNLAVNSFNDATTSYNHNSIGGYHAAKLQRYQDVIDGYLSKQHLGVLRALNTKYYIVPDSVSGVSVMQDADAYGNAWFAQNVKRVADANEEFTSLGEVDLSTTAVVAPPYSSQLSSSTTPIDSLASVKIVSYEPDKIIYKTNSTTGGLVVFSEIFYPHGWQASISGKEQSILRVDYLLRGLEVPAGEHEVVFTFAPKSVQTTEAISYTATGILLLTAIGGLVYYMRKKKTKVA